MFIAEIFHSIQGEGMLAGVPSVFIRTSGCNLRCKWCDTPYASWRPEGENLSLDDVVAAATAFPSRHCVLTGGEPMVAKDIHLLAGALRDAGFHITIETAGTIAPEGIACDLASISPKLSNSTPAADFIETGWVARHEERRWRPDLIGSWIDASKDYQLKFVLGNPADLEEIEFFLRATDRRIDPAHVLLMPEGIDDQAMDSAGTWLPRMCLKKGYRYCDRLHIRLFGNTKGT